MHLYIYRFFFSPEHHRSVTCRSSEIVKRWRVFSSHPISTSDPFLPTVLINVVGCHAEGENGLKSVCVDCVRRMHFIKKPGNWATMEIVDEIIHIMRFVLPEANVANI